MFTTESSMGLTDYIIVPICFSSLILYHIYYFVRLIVHPDRVSLGINLIERTRWVRWMMTDSKNGSEILGVQTLRNLTMGASFLATAVVATSVSLLNTLLDESISAANSDSE